MTKIRDFSLIISIKYIKYKYLNKGGYTIPLGQTPLYEIHVDYSFMFKYKTHDS